MIDIFALNWQNNIIDIPDDIKNWLFDDGSLTTKLKQEYPNFKVELLSEIKDKDFIRREVNLCDDSQVLVNAISFIPQKCHKLQNLGNKPLGEIIFQNSKRLEIKIIKHNNIWGRKSVFLFEDFEVIVCEFFMSLSK